MITITIIVLILMFLANWYGQSQYALSKDAERLASAASVKEGSEASDKEGSEATVQNTERSDGIQGEL